MLETVLESSPPGLTKVKGGLCGRDNVDGVAYEAEGFSSDDDRGLS